VRSIATTAIDIHPRALAQFVAVVEHRHLGRAAAAMRVSQRSLGKTLSQLERDAGEPLLLPSTRSVALTPAGEVFAGSARRVLEAMERLRAAASVDLATVRVAHLADADTMAIVLDDLAREQADVAVEEQVASEVEQLAMVAGHRLDLALCPVPGALPNSLLAIPVREDPLVVVCPADRHVATPIDLHDEPLVVPVYGDHWPRFDAFVDEFAALHGVALERIPVAGGTARELDALLRRSAHRRVLMMQSAAARTTRPVGRPSGVQPFLTWHLVWRTGAVLPEVQAVVDTARVVAATHGWLDTAAPGEPWWPAAQLRLAA
jgi:DNA-binding transcriptional LysR family regulator